MDAVGQPSQKKRIDLLLVERGLARSREEGRRLVMAGLVRAGGRRVEKAGMTLSADAALEVRARSRYVGRGGLKLEHALARFRLDVTGRVAADLGSSTGGFTDCLLQHGAVRVYAVDVGTNQLDWSLRTDPRVVAMEQTNARYLEALPEPVDVVTIDVSFISLCLVLPTARRLLQPEGRVVALVKPQFEAGREKVGKGGVVRDERVHAEVLASLLAWCAAAGWGVAGLTASPLLGPAGNREFLLHLITAPSGDEPDAAELVRAALAEPIPENEKA